MKIIDIRHSIRKHPTKQPDKRKMSDIKFIILHHSLTKTGSAEAYADYHIGTNGWSRMGYPYVIEQNGDVKFCADHTTVTPHVGKHNRYSFGICLTGDFREQKPTPEQYRSLMELLVTLRGVLPNAEIKGHSELEGYSWKPCPVISMDQVRKDFEEKVNPMAKEQGVSSWAKEAQQWVIEQGISDGKDPKKPVTREEVWTMINRAFLGANKVK